MFGKEGCL